MRNSAIILCMALLGMLSCSKHDVDDAAPLYPIQFGQPYVESSTKGYNPSHTTGSLDEITVYGSATVEEGEVITTTNIFPGIAVTKGSTGWGYDNQYQQYWFAHTEYEFVAVAGAGEGVSVNTGSNGIPVSLDYNVAGQQDLLLDTHYHGIHGDIHQEAGHKTTTINFVMNHLLSKVKFTFKNGHPLNSGIELAVKDVKIKNAYGTATYTLAQGATEAPWGSWGAQSGSQELNFGNATTSAQKDSPNFDFITTSNGSGICSNHQMMMIPGEYSGTEVTFTVELYMYPQMIMGESAQRALLATKDYTRTLPDFTLQQGKCYNILTGIEMQLDEVTFQIHQTTGWEN